MINKQIKKQNKSRNVVSYFWVSAILGVICICTQFALARVTFLGPTMFIEGDECLFSLKGNVHNYVSISEGEGGHEMLMTAYLWDTALP